MIPKSPNHQKITLWERTLSALIIAIITSLICLAFSFLLIRAANTSSDSARFILNIYWNGSLALITLSAILGFMFGGSRMAHLVGIIFRTNKPKDGNWF